MNKRVFCILCVVLANFLSLKVIYGQVAQRVPAVGISQIGNELSPNSNFFAYTTVNYNNRTEKIKYGFNIVYATQLDKISYSNDSLRFIGFLKDSTVLVVNESNDLFSYNVILGEVDKKFDIKIESGVYYSFNLKLSKGTLYFIESNKIVRFNLYTGEKSTFIVLDDFNTEYVEFASFDIINELVILCLKTPLDTTNEVFYHYYSWDIEKRQEILLFKGEKISQLTYAPIVRFSDTENLWIAFFDGSTSFLKHFDLKNNILSDAMRWSDKIIINASISKNGMKYLTLFSELEREKFAATNFETLGAGVLLSGSSVYKY
jgi:hypothetical protein